MLHITKMNHPASLSSQEGKHTMGEGKGNDKVVSRSL